MNSLITMDSLIIDGFSWSAVELISHIIGVQ